MKYVVDVCNLNPKIYVYKVKIFEYTLKKMPDLHSNPDPKRWPWPLERESNLISKHVTIY